MTEHDIAHVDPTRLARQLNRCRQHGLDDLDLDLHNKPRVPEDEIAELAYVARAFCAAIGVTAPTRGAAILRLIQDGLAAYAEQGDRGDSEFVKQFFFERSEVAGPSAAVGRRDDRPASDPLPAVLKPRKGARIKDLATELHLSDKRLAELRDAAFIRFATFLIAFVADVSHVVPASQVREVVPIAPPQPPPPSTQSRHRWPRRRWVGLGLAGLVVASSLVVAFLLMSRPGTAHTPTQAAARTATASHERPGKTYTEMTGEFGAPTFADPHTVSGEGTKIKPYTQVQVLCKVLAPSIPSVSPDGYWYLIASSPWSGGFYAAANTFMNGDHVGQTTALHNTDFAVPDCPS